MEWSHNTTAFYRKRLKWKLGDLHARVRDDMIATAWKYKWDGWRLMNMYKQWAERNLCVKHKKVQDLLLLETESCSSMGYVDKGHRITNAHSVKEHENEHKIMCSPAISNCNE
jgi:hypothetical protein